MVVVRDNVDVRPSGTFAVPQGYKRTEAGVIPQDWTSLTIGDLFVFKNGLNKAKRFFGSGTPIVNYMDVFEKPGLYVTDLDGSVTLTPKEIESYSVQKGDVFFTRTSETPDEIGIASVMLDEPADTVFSGFVLRARPISDRLADAYKKYCFSSTLVRSQIVSKATYTTRALTNGRSLSSVFIALPPATEQHAIAAALSDVDELIETQDALIVKKRAIKQGAMQQLLTGKTRLPGSTGEWEPCRIADIGSLYGGLSGKVKADFGVGEARYVTFLNVLGNVILDANLLESVRVAIHEKQNRVLQGDILFNATSETPDELAIASVMSEHIDSLYLNSFCFGLRPHDLQQNDPLFLAYYFRGPPGRNIMRALAQGATRHNLSKSQFRELSLTIPGFDEQSTIATVLADMDAEIEALEERRDKIQAIKQGMMQQLLTGRVRLVEPEKAAAIA